MQLNLSMFYTQTVFHQAAGNYETGHPLCKFWWYAVKKAGGADTHHFHVDPNSCFHLNEVLDQTSHFNADPDPAPNKCNANLRQRPSMAPY
jgi:hypothetical protein